MHFYQLQLKKIVNNKYVLNMFNKYLRINIVNIVYNVNTVC